MRKGARSRAEVPPEVLAALNAGTMETASLPECLAVDFAALMGAVFPAIDPAPLEVAAGDGVTRRMALAAELAAEHLDTMAGHGSDTVRGWACYAIGRRPGWTLAQRLERLRPLADDPHFGVREWAWLALRPHVVAEPRAAIALLAPWTAEASANLRRFASEATRPRGVWCAHVAALRADPAPGLAVLEPLRADPARYVQDSVANWLNDAGKDHPDWVRDLCQCWTKDGGGKAIAYVVRRACRNL
ncbi:MAG TPA: DNA alkylation repair protein [Candidatus Omnitrophota bacterium]|nr:DNA alkylation repair protein [Candidatus Omnitrophota bacterium]